MPSVHHLHTHERKKGRKDSKMDIKVDEKEGKWYIFKGNKQIKGPFDSSSQAWKEVERLEVQDTWVSSRKQFRNPTHLKE